MRRRRVTNRHQFTNKENDLIVDQAFDGLVCGGSLYVSLPTLHKKGQRGKEEIKEGQCTLNGWSCLALTNAYPRQGSHLSPRGFDVKDAVVRARVSICATTG